GITFKNIKIISEENNPVIDITQSDKLVFQNISTKKGEFLRFRINGERTTAITINNKEDVKANTTITYELGADPKSVTNK
ncbi:MAG: glycoside hydrolase family 28 protein, partial [Chitinophagaceae bacterium]